jgi:hypothetical protein
MRIEQGGAADAQRLLGLFDDAVAWLVARGQTGQWGTEPFSARPAQVARVRGWAALIGHAAQLARAAGAEQLRVDCWAGVPELPAAYERLGFSRTGSFDVDGWPGAILVREL